MSFGPHVSEADRRLIAKHLAKGERQADIAREFGFSTGTISKINRKHSKLVEIETYKLLKALPDITENTIRDIQTLNKVSKVLAGEQDQSTLSEAFKTNTVIYNKDGAVYKEESGLNTPLVSAFITATKKTQKEILQAVGILPSPITNQNNQFNILTQNNNMEVVNPSVLKAIGKHILDITSDEPLDDPLSPQWSSESYPEQTDPPPPEATDNAQSDQIPQ